MTIARALDKINGELENTDARLVAVSKTFPASAIWEAYDHGQLVFGESTAQELCEKYEILPKDIEWHFIGHLQTNKVKYIAPFVHMIHAVDSLKLLQTINKEAEKHNRVIDVLLQIHIADEETKYGLYEDDIIGVLGDPSYVKMKNIQVRGLMGIATQTNDSFKIEGEFLQLRDIFTRLKFTVFNDDPLFNELSMGMSYDYKLALRHGSTLIRVGSLIFGNREYTPN